MRIQLVSLTGLFLLPLADSAAGGVYVGHVPHATYRGESRGERLGIAISNAGDVNGDGVNDLLVGAIGKMAGGEVGGSARVISGVDGKLLHTFVSPLDGAFGQSVAGAGDVNADGFADLIVGAPSGDEAGNLSGMVRVYSGHDGRVLYTFTGDKADERFGAAIAGVGDVNADGFADLIVGAPGIDGGYARVFSGRDGEILFTVRQENKFDWFGCSVAGIGDVDEDGRPDFAVGAEGHDANGEDSGSLSVYSGRTGARLYIVHGTRFSPFANAVAAAGDVNGDGIPDLIVGADGDGLLGEAHVLSGRDGKRIHSFEGLRRGDGFGHSVSGAGDVDGDGFANLIVGAWSDNANGPLSGSVYVFSGRDGRVICKLVGDGAGNRFGYSVAGVGDINSDGLADFVVGAHGGGTDRQGYTLLFVSRVEPDVGGVEDE
ncbi:MAG: FG-GAP-like repeat-containing protein [Phycisphaerae bacterium]